VGKEKGWEVKQTLLQKGYGVMAVKLNVPMVTQRLAMECWYAAVCMLGYFRVAGPRLGLPDKWIPNQGIGLADFVRLAQAEGLKATLTPAGDLTAQQLEVLLRNNGPIWCAGRWDGAPHIVVLTGVDGQNVYINDPNPTKRARVETLAWFNTKLDRVPNCLMYLPA
jgi:ABC-type bacteriocin/lantibiotic exporter with double-glycine peptidase domain